MSLIRKSFTLLALLLTTSAVSGEQMLSRPPEVPQDVEFIRSLDVEGYVTRTNYHGMGAQSGRIRLRFRDPDPDINAFVGMMVGVHRFNQELRIGELDKLGTSFAMVNWGGVFGIVRGKHLWEIDLLGANLGPRLGAAVAIVGEHTLSKTITFYHRTEVNGWTMDAVLDADQGFYWMVKPTVGLSVGYRWFTSLHMDRSGPHIGLRLYFESPKIPFIFPSLG